MRVKQKKNKKFIGINKINSKAKIGFLVSNFLSLNPNMFLTNFQRGYEEFFLNLKNNTRLRLHFSA